MAVTAEQERVVEVHRYRFTTPSLHRRRLRAHGSGERGETLVGIAVADFRLPVEEIFGR